jgi:O-antigen ligase
MRSDVGARDHVHQTTVQSSAVGTRTRGALWFGVLTAALAGGGVVLAMAYRMLSQFDVALAAFVVAVPIVVVATALALFRFEWFVLALIIARSSLDILHLGDPGGRNLDPASALGIMFIATASLWLVIQHQAGSTVPPSPATRGLVALVGACVLSCPLSGDVIASIQTTSKVLAGVLMFVVLEQLLARDGRRARLVVVATLVSFVLPALFGMRQWLGGIGATRVQPSARGSDTLDAVSRVKGTFVHPNPFATYLVLVLLLAVAVVLVVNKGQRLSLAIVVVGAGVLILVTYTRVAWAAALVGCVYLGLRHHKAILVTLVAGLIVIGVAVPSTSSRLSDLTGSGPQIPGVPSNSLNWRIGYWRELIPLANRMPVTGIGIGTSQFETEQGLLPHSVFVQAYVETGVAGVLAILAVIIGFATTLRRRLREAAAGWERALAMAAIATALAVLAQMPTENLLTQSVNYWYLAAAGTFGLGHARIRHASSAMEGVRT